MADRKSLALHIHPEWPFNMLRIRAAPKADADVIEIILPSSFRDLSLVGFDVGDFWEVSRPTGNAYVIKAYDGYTTLVPAALDTVSFGPDAVDQRMVQVQTIAGDVVFGPMQLPLSLTTIGFKKKFQNECPSWSSSAFNLLLGEKVLQDSDLLFDREGDDDVVTLTVVQLYAHVDEAVDIWSGWADSDTICHVAYGDGGRVRMRLTFHAPVLQAMPDTKLAADNARQMESELSIEQFKKLISKWPIAVDNFRRHHGQSGRPSLSSRFQEVVEMAEKYAMRIVNHGQLVWSPEWKCDLCKDGWTLPCIIQQDVQSCDLD